MNAEFAAVAARAPKATICLNSGLSYWDLSDELPDSVHLAVARGGALAQDRHAGDDAASLRGCNVRA
jgi:predicted transcriptional regulator of viral defense system